MKTLLGHTSPETAYVVADYPYGYRLRTQIRYWLETRKGYGQRLMSQTLNPKTGQWNKPKAGTYNVLAVMVLDDQEHVALDVLRSGGWDDEAKVQAFETQHTEALGEYEHRAIKYVRASNAANARIKWTIVNEGEEAAVQTLQEQAAIYRAVVAQEYRKLEEPKC